MGRPYRRPRRRRKPAPRPCAARRRSAGSGRRKSVEGAARAPIPLPGDPRAALRPDRRLPGGPLRRGRDHAARRRARDGHGGAPAAEGPRRLRHQRRPPARQAGRAAAARLRRPRSRPGSRRPTASRRSRSPARASSTSASTPAPRARSPTTSSRPARRTAAPRRGRSRRSTSSSSRPTRPARSHLGQRPVGGGRRRPGPAARGDAATSSPGSTTSTTTAPRSTGSAGRCSRPRRHEPTPEDGYPAAVHHRDRRAGRRRRTPRLPACPTTRRSRCSARTASG